MADETPAGIGKGDHLYLIDGSGYIFRAYHALPPLTRKSDGLPVGAVAGYCNMLHKMLMGFGTGGPTHLAVIFDYSGRSFRNDLYPEYKAHRPPAPEDLIPQFPLIRDATRAFGIPCIEMEGFEADDLIATYARLASEAGATVTVVSSDKDLMQLVGGGVDMLDPMKNIEIGPDQVFEKFGVGPDRVVDVQALSGDSVDNIPGAKGIGEKTASELVAEAGSLDNLLSQERRNEILKASENEFSNIISDFETHLGRKIKIGSKKDAWEIFVRYHGKEKIYSNEELSTQQLQDYAKQGYETAGRILRGRFLARTIPSALEKIASQTEEVLLSRELVRLRNDVPVKEQLAEFIVEKPNPDALLGFLAQMEFRTLANRLAEVLGVEPPVIGAVEAPRAAVQDGPADAPSRTADGPGAVREMPPIDRDTYVTIRDADTLTEWIAEATANGHLCVDLETTSLDEMQAEIVGVALATAPGKAAYVPVAHVIGDGDLLGKVERVPDQLALEAVLDALKPVLADPATLKIGQNLKYDLKVLKRHGVEVTPIDDTMLMSYALDSGISSHGMDVLSERHLGHRTVHIKDLIGSGKTAITFDKVDLDKAATYAAEDADITLRLWEVLRPRLAAERVSTVYHTLERPLIPVLVEMELAGIKVDRDTLSRLSNSFAQSMAGLEAEIEKLVGHPFNIGSPKQLGEILFDEMGLPGGKKGKTGAWGTGADVLETLAAEGHDLPARVLDWRQLAKLKSTYTDSLQNHINPETGRVHTSFSLAATSTGRLASTDPNLQNIPVRSEEGRQIRTAFVAEPGNVILSLDYSQIELRIFAHMAGIDALKEAFHKGLDIHAMTASEVFGVPIEGMDPMVRRQAKAINFGVIYGISAFGLSNQLRIPRGEAQKFIDAYFERFPGIRAYMEATKEHAREKGYVETLFGRRIHTPDINQKGPGRGFAERAAINAPIQGTAADVIRRAMIRIPDALAGAKLSARMLLQVHDELLFEVSDSEAEATAGTVRKVMEGAAHPAVHLDVPLVVDAGQGASWAEAH